MNLKPRHEGGLEQHACDAQTDNVHCPKFPENVFPAEGVCIPIIGHITRLYKALLEWLTVLGTFSASVR